MHHFIPKLILVLLFAASFTALTAQCTEITLNTLQVIQNAAPEQKENKILGAGFDLRNEITRKGEVTKIYTKCWVTTIKSKNYFEQKLFWNQADGSIKLAMLNQVQFQNLRKSLDERHPSGAGATVVVGKMYKYYLGSELIDGMDYYTIILSKR